MLTLGMTAGNDKDCIFVVKITIDGTTTFYFSDTEDKITLSTIDFDGKVMFKDSLGEFQKGVDISYGGGIGQVGTFSFGLARYNSYSGASDFFDDFFPATSGARLTGKTVEVGIVWSGATTTSQITWLNKYFIDTYTYSFGQMQFQCLEYDELSQREIPHWKIQNETDDKISYFPNAPKESLGVAMPVVYGDFTTAGGETKTTKNRFGFAPCILVEPTKNQFVAASHEVNEVNDNGDNSEHICESWVSGIDQYMIIANNGAGSSTGTNYNNDITGYHFTMLNNAGYSLRGNLTVPLKVASAFSDSLDLEEIVNDDVTDYLEISGGDEIALRVGESSSSNFGSLGTAANEIIIWFVASTDGGGNRDWRISYYNDAPSTPGAGTNDTGTLTTTTATGTSLTFGNSTTAKKDSVLPWTLDELAGLDYRFENTEAVAGDKLRVYDAYLQLTNIKIVTVNTSYSYYGGFQVPTPRIGNIHIRIPGL